MKNEENTIPEWEVQLRADLNHLMFYEYDYFNKVLKTWVNNWTQKVQRFDGLMLSSTTGMPELMYGWSIVKINVAWRLFSPFILIIRYEPDNERQFALQLEHTISYGAGADNCWTELRSDTEYFRDPEALDEAFVCRLLNERFLQYLRWIETKEHGI